MNIRNRKSLPKTLIAIGAGFLLSGCATIEEAARNNPNGLAATTGLFVGAGAGLACSMMSGGSEMMSDNVNNPLSGVSKKDARCTALAAIVGGATWLASSRIYRNMSEQDQRAALEAASQSLETGQPISIELPDSGDMFSVTTVAEVPGEFSTETIEADLARLPRLDEQYVSIGRYYSAPSNVNVRSGPGVQFDQADALEPNDVVHVFGKAPESDWLLVGKGVEKKSNWGIGSTTQPVAIGYIRQDLLQEVEAERGEAVPISPFSAADTESVRNVEAEWAITCTSQSLKLVGGADGKVTEDKSELCYGPLGEVST